MPIEKRGKTIGLTGGIASGKSTFAKLMVDRGALLIDLDQLGHQVYEPDQEAYAKIIAAFGNSIVGADKRIDRKALGKLLFGNKEVMAKLNAIVWPPILSLARKEITRLRSQFPDRLILVEGALLIEANCKDMFDELWVVYCDPETAIARQIARNGIPKDEAKKRLASQIDNETRLKFADRAIANNGSLEDLKAAVERLTPSL